MVSAEDISFRVKDKILLHPSTIGFDVSRFHVIMGPNGAGKTTLLKLLAGAEKPFSGTIKIDGKEIKEYNQQQLARKRAVLSQHYDISFPVSVEDIIMMGRYPYFNSSPNAYDVEVCNKVMKKMEVMDFRNRDYNTLSGGEGQKVQMCRVLAQIDDVKDTSYKLLFLDEPVSHLDVKYQYQLLQEAKYLNSHNITIIAILHDMNLALSFADRILFMKQGKIYQDLRDIYKVSSQIIEEVFDVKCRIIYPEGDKPVVIF
jgi:iron complex transport system ATP-binding protein